jgi:hypothetical protein
MNRTYLNIEDAKAWATPNGITMQDELVRAKKHLASLKEEEYQAQLVKWIVDRSFDIYTYKLLAALTFNSAGKDIVKAKAAVTIASNRVAAMSDEVLQRARQAKYDKADDYPQVLLSSPPSVAVRCVSLPPLRIHYLLHLAFFELLLGLSQGCSSLRQLQLEITPLRRWLLLTTMVTELDRAKEHLEWAEMEKENGLRMLFTIGHDYETTEYNDEVDTAIRTGWAAVEWAKQSLEKATARVSPLTDEALEAARQEKYKAAPQVL